jgi:HEPN domain-containing protein
MNSLVDILIEKSDHDLDAAKRTFQDRPNHSDIIAFHCQQTIEKIFKAYLVFREFQIKKNHDLIELLKYILV